MKTIKNSYKGGRRDGSAADRVQKASVSPGTQTLRLKLHPAAADLMLLASLGTCTPVCGHTHKNIIKNKSLKKQKKKHANLRKWLSSGTFIYLACAKS